MGRGGLPIYQLQRREVLAYQFREARTVRGKGKAASKKERIRRGSLRKRWELDKRGLGEIVLSGE